MVTFRIKFYLKNYLLNYIFAIIVDPLNVESQNQAKNIPCSWVPQSKFEANRSRGSLVMIRQTNRGDNFKYLDLPIKRKLFYQVLVKKIAQKRLLILF